MFDTALREIIDGKKESCWIWFVFPAADFPGGSATNKFYALGSGEEAKNNAKKYLADKILGKRLKEIIFGSQDFGKQHQEVSFGLKDIGS